MVSTFLGAEEGEFDGIERVKFVAKNDGFFVRKAFPQGFGPAGKGVAAGALGKDDFCFAILVAHFEEHLVRFF